ncbi:hypothetical protein Tco_0938289 [Tanacetum coccineum]|uniref:Uncharacterized protein n=1 Tax=Tanacetum coccineum TaxID=301880 RepID=A0ABQ5DNP3_9ASTR
MMVQDQEEMGKCLANPTDPHHTPTIIQPSTSHPQKKQRSRRLKRKDTKIPQSSGPTDNVADEAINEEMDDSLVRAATTATGLDAEQDCGNIDKTQSKATPNEPSSLGTSSGGGPRRQETIGDTIAQTRFENVSKLSNDPLLTRGNTLRSGEDRLKLQELMELCTTLQSRVLALDTTKTTQDNEIDSEEDASKQGRRIHDIDADEDITLVNDQDDADMFGVNDLDGDELRSEFKKKADVVEEPSESITTTPTLTTTAATTIIVVSTRPKAKRLVIHEEEQATTPTVSSQQPSQVKVQDKGKGIIVEEPVKMKKKDQISLDEELAFKLQAEEEEEERFAIEKAQQVEEANIAWDDVQSKIEGDELEQESIKKQKVDDDQETTELQRLIEVVPDKEEVAIDAIPLATKPPRIVDYKIHKEGKKTYYQIIRVDGSSKIYLVLREGYKRVLWDDLKTMFDPHVEDEVWRNQQDYRVLDWKIYDSCRVHSLRMQHMHIHMLVEKRYPLKPATITDMLNKKLQCDHFSKMLSMKKLEILKKNIKFRGGLLGLKDFMMILKLLLLS